MRFSLLLAGGMIAGALSSLGTSSANALTGWLPVVVAHGPLKEQIQSLPIELRPNRPLHFYGNAVRRNYYRSQPAPVAYPSVYSPHVSPYHQPAPYYYSPY
jgi:hypothetical protein